MNRYLGRTMEYGGFWLTFDKNVDSVKIYVRPARPVPSDLDNAQHVTYYIWGVDVGEHEIERFIDVFVAFINLGARIKANEIRKALGTKAESCRCDNIIGPGRQKYEIFSDPYTWRKEQWVL